MRRVAILAAALALLPLPAAAADYAWPVVRVIDGDTIVVDASADLPAELAELRVRLRGIDAPEVGHRARCEAEREAGAAATARVAALLDAAETVVVRDPEWGKWGGRVVADVVLDDDYSLADWVVIGGVNWCHGAGFADGPPDLQAEMERHVLDPCLAASVRNGAVPAGLVDGMEEAGAVATLKRVASAQVARLAPLVRPLMAGRPWPLRQRFYEVIRDICIADYGGGAT